MAVFRVEKTRNYTVMSNYHLRDKSLSLKAKGLLSLMLSLPEDWDYTTKGLARICKDGVDSICATVRELEGAGYIVRERERHADGTLGGIEYTILEQPREPEPPKRENPVQAENTGDAPKRAFPEQVKPVLEKPEQENPAQLNIQEESKEILSTDSTKSFPSFPHKGKPIQESGMERRETYRERIMTNVDYDYLVGYTEVDRARLDELVELMKNSKEVLQCYHVTGAYTFLIKVSCGSMPQLEHLILQFQKLGTTSTQIILSTPVNHGDLEAMML